MHLCDEPLDARIRAALKTLRRDAEQIQLAREYLERELADLEAAY